MQFNVPDLSQQKRRKKMFLNCFVHWKHSLPSIPTGHPLAFQSTCTNTTTSRSATICRDGPRQRTHWRFRWFLECLSSTRKRWEYSLAIRSGWATEKRPSLCFIRDRQKQRRYVWPCRTTVIGWRTSLTWLRVIINDNPCHSSSRTGIAEWAISLWRLSPTSPISGWYTRQQLFVY